MKKVIKILFWIILIPYIAIVIFLTACLLNYNKYNVTVFGNKSLVIINHDEIEGYQKGDLVIVEKGKNSDIQVGDKIFFYNPEDEDNIISYGEVKNATKVTEKESTYDMGNNFLLSSEYVIGKADTSQVYHTVGGILGTLESRWGFLFFVIFPVLVLFIYEIYMLIRELRGEKNKKEA